MVEFIARWLDDSGTSPLILTRGYAGGDEAKMLQSHLLGTSAKIGVGANRAATAACFLERYGYMDPHISDQKTRSHQELGKIGAAILDDGMQASDQNIDSIESMLGKLKESLPVFLTRMAPSCFFNVEDTSCRLPLRIVYNMVVLCVSAIGFPNAFVQGIEKIGAMHVDRLDFSDHHLFQAKDMEMISMRLQKLQAKFGSKPIVIFTEKDYYREPEILRHLHPFEVLVLCSELQILSREGHTEDSYKNLLRQLLEAKLSGVNRT